MKKLLSFFFFLIVAQAAHAQSGIFNFGVKGGLGFTDVSFNENTTIKDFDAAQSWHLGITTRIKVPLVGFYVQPELYYSQSGGEITLSEADKVQDFSQKRIDLPVLLGFRIGVDAIGVRFNAGPMASFVLDDGFSDLPELGDISKNDFIWGYQAGVGVDVSKFSVDARYEGNFNNFVDSIKGASVDGKTNQWTLSLGYWF